MLAYTAYQIMDAAERNARGAPFFADDGTLQRYAPSADPLSNSLVLERFEPSVSASPEETGDHWVSDAHSWCDHMRNTRTVRSCLNTS
jgi:hypothetical protein